MYILELRVNGELVSTAGAEDLSVLSQTLSLVGKLGAESQGTKVVKDGVQVKLDVGGLTSRASEPSHLHFTWYDTKTISLEDEISVRIRTGDAADSPLQAEPQAIENAREQSKKLERRRFEDAKRYYLENRDKYED